MHRRDILKSAASVAAIGSAGLGRPAIAQGAAKTLRFVPQANLSSLDPIWTTAATATNYGYMVFDTLYGIDDRLEAQRQMCAGHEVSPDRLTWTFTLREGLLFHDNEKVRAVDCTTSLARWAVKDPFGQQIALQTEEMKPLDDKRFQIRLKKPFSHMLYALSARACFMMPERMAKTPASEQIKEHVGSGPFRFLASEWVSGARAAWAKFDKYVPRQEPPQYFSGGKIVNIDRVEWIVQPEAATAAAALQTGEVDWVEWPLIDLLPMLKGADGVEVKTSIDLATSACWRSTTSIRRSTTRSSCAPCCPRWIRRPMSGGCWRADGPRPLSGGFLHRRHADGEQDWVEVLSGPRDIALRRSWLRNPATMVS